MRKLVLYSNQIYGGQTNSATAKIDQQLLTLLGETEAGESPRIGYIPSRHHPEQKYFLGTWAYYAEHNVDLAVNFPLDAAYESQKLDTLLECDAIHLSGGNTFYFLYWLRKRNMVEVLRSYVADGGTIIGVSAGAILMTPHITSALWCGDEPLPAMTDYHALGLVDFAFVPHYQASTARLAELQRYSQLHDICIYACSDESGIVVHNEQITCIGDVVIIKDGIIKQNTRLSNVRK